MFLLPFLLAGCGGMRGMSEEVARPLFEPLEEAWQAESWEEVRRLARPLLKTLNPYAERALYYDGMAALRLGKDRKAYLLFRGYHTRFPNGAHNAAIAEALHDMAFAAIEAGETRVGGSGFLGRGIAATKALALCIDLDPYGPVAAESQYRIGVLFQEHGAFEDAAHTFDLLEQRYPGSGWVEAGRLRRAECLLAASRGPGYDPAMREEALTAARTYGGPDRGRAEGLAARVAEGQAEHLWGVARTYRSLGKPEAERICLQDLMRRHPGTEWAARAADRLEATDGGE